MKKRVFRAAAVLLFCLSLSACGKQATVGPTGSTVYSDIVYESQSLYNVTGSRYAQCLGTQYYQGEPIQLWSDIDDSGRQSEIYAYKSDGSRELLFEGMDWNFYLSASGYLDNEGNLYSWRLQGSFSKTSPSGELLYNKELSIFEVENIKDMCQTSDGHIFVLCQSVSKGSSALGELNPDTGEISILANRSGDSYLGTGEEGLFLVDSNSLWKVDTEDGSLEKQLSFAGTTYVSYRSDAQVQDFLVTENQGMELLRTDYHGRHWELETVQRVELGTEKTVLTMRGNFANQNWIREQVNAFNLSGSDYYVVMEDSGTYADSEDCARLTSVEIATGKGPDLLYGNVLGDYLYGTIQKGGLEDLASYMKKSGIKEKDYFSAAFNRWRDGKKIYGACVRFDGVTYVMDAAVLGTDKEPTVETLVEALLAYRGQDIYMQNCDSQEVLRMLLEGSEDLWGMINWKKGTCDFSGKLFAGILETAKLYGDDGRKLSSGLLDYNICWVYVYLDPDMLKQKGLVPVGILFDDGVHGMPRPFSDTIAINANSANKQGAWEFVRFLLGKEAQTAAGTASSQWPVNKSVCQAYLEELLETSTQRETDTLHKLTKDRIKYLMEELEDIRFLPMRTEPVLDIICDEADDYFRGIKGIDEIIPIIQNRVKLYLEETGS